MNTRQKNKELQTSARVLHLENIMFSTPKTLFKKTKQKKLNTSDNSSGRHIGNYAAAAAAALPPPTKEEKPEQQSLHNMKKKRKT